MVGGEAVRTGIRKLDISAYGLHLALDTAEGGLIDSLADAFELDNKVPVPIEYKGKIVKKGAIIGSAEKNLGYFLTRFAETNGRNGFNGMNVKVHNNYEYGRVFRDVIVSTGPFIRKPFLEQLRTHRPDLVIAGDVDGNDSVKYANDQGMCLMTIGNFDSHYTGMITFTSKLRQQTSLELEHTGCNVLLVPNYPI
jgi:putative NIF3 family GTP cyclohydrolase 1 type 2